jgi:hypothetical protein
VEYIGTLHVVDRAAITLAIRDDLGIHLKLARVDAIEERPSEKEVENDG